jgi:hypothetical protein
MEFEPLLPDDEQPLNGRANALALWCTGFLYGLGTGQISDLEALNGDVGEIVRDFTEISRATGDDADADESNEQAYAELVEFIRVAAQVVFEELAAFAQTFIRLLSNGCTSVPEMRINSRSVWTCDTALVVAIAALSPDCAHFPGHGPQGVHAPAPAVHAHDRQGRDRHSAGGPGAPSQRRHRVRLPAGQPFSLFNGFPEPEAVAVLVPGRKQASICCSCANATPSASPGMGRGPAPTAP